MIGALTGAEVDGTYEFTGLTAGTYMVESIGPDGWVLTTASPLNIMFGTDDELFENGDFSFGGDFGDPPSIDPLDFGSAGFALPPEAVETLRERELTAEEIIAFCKLNGIPGDGIGDFAESLADYRHEALMRMGGRRALPCALGESGWGLSWTSA